MVTNFDGSGMAEFSREVAGDVIRVAVLAADREALKPAPVSRMRDPDGSVQRETSAEYTRRLVRTAIMHLLEQGLIVFPGDIGELLDQPIPMEREGRD